jgi:hypothetical protein
MLLILSEKNDISSLKVERWLNYYNAKYLRINKEEQENIFSSLELSVKNDELHFEFNKKKYKLSDFSVIWNRRGYVNLKWPVLQKKDNINPHLIKALTINIQDEYNTLINYIYYKIGQKRAINNPSKYNINKLIVLDKAKQHGFVIPQTSISLNPSEYLYPDKKYINLSSIFN